MRRKVTFNKSGSGSISAKIIIPSLFLELMKITENDRNIDIKFEDNKIIIEKV